MGVCEAALSKLLGRFVRGHYRQRFIQFPFGYLIKVIAVEVREKHKIQWRQLIDLRSRVCQACGVKPITDRNQFMHVDEGGIGQNRKIRQNE